MLAPQYRMPTKPTMNFIEGRDRQMQEVHWGETATTSAALTAKTKYVNKDLMAILLVCRWLLDREDRKNDEVVLFLKSCVNLEAVKIDKETQTLQTTGSEKVVFYATSFEHNCKLYAFAALSTVVTSFTIWYVQNATMTVNPDTRLLLDNPDTNVFRLVLLATVTIIIQKALTNSICGELCWSKARGKRQISVLSFLLLSASPSPLTLLRILCRMRWPNSLAKKNLLQLFNELLRFIKQ